MMEKNNNYEIFDAKIDRFLRHQMTSQEEQQFKAELAASPELMARAKTMALMIKSMSEVGLKRDQQFVDEIKGMNEAEFRKVAGLKPRVKVVSFWPRFTRYVAAACVAGFLWWGGIHYYNIHQTISLGNSFDYYAYNMDISDGEYVRGITDSEILDQLPTLFDNVKEGKDLKETIVQLETLYPKALEEESEYSQYDNDIAWNLAIAYLKDGDRKKPIPVLELMITRNQDYPEITKPAQELLDKIKAL